MSCVYSHYYTEISCIIICVNMLNPIYKESDLTFEFNHDWEVMKYDEHAYFKILSGSGLKGVDFIGIYQHKWLYLIEVKNYHRRSYSPKEPDWSALKGNNPALVNDFFEKIVDSLKLIWLVERYLQRQWWYSVASWLRRLLNRNKMSKDWHFWKAVNTIALEPDNILAVLWIESGSPLLESLHTTEDVFLGLLSDAIEIKFSSQKIGSLTVISKARESSVGSLPGVTVV